MSPTEWKLFLLELRREAAGMEPCYWSWDTQKTLDFAWEFRGSAGRLGIIIVEKTRKELTIEVTVSITTDPDPFLRLLRMDSSLRRQLCLVAGEGIFALTPSD